MAEVKFILKEPKSKANTLIYLFYNFNNQRLKYSFGQKVNPKFWNFEKQRIKETKQFPEYPEFNSMLNNLETTVNNLYRKLINDSITPTPHLLKDGLNDILANKQPRTLSFFDFIEEHIILSNKKPNTIKQYKQTFRMLKEYAKAKNTSISFNDIDIDFYESFIKYLRDLKYSENTIGGYIKDTKVFMNEALERKLTTNTEHRSKRFKKIQEVTDKIYLNLQEIDELYNLDLSTQPRLEKVRDLFVFACYTGLRFSDLSHISTDNLINDKTQLKIKTEKTGEFVVIPLHRIVKEIFQKYDNQIPKVISNQKMNEYIKDVGKMAGFDELVSISTTKGGERQTQTFAKYELITVHTARRSFATNMYLLNIPPISIMKITGHRTERAFLTYIKITQEENATKLLNHPFFQ